MTDKPTINDRADDTSGRGKYEHPGMIQTSSNVFLDNYAKYQSTGRTQGMTGNTEVDRLMREKAELIKTGSYTIEDPLIMEIDRQIKASQLRS